MSEAVHHIVARLQKNFAKVDAAMKSVAEARRCMAEISVDLDVLKTCASRHLPNSLAAQEPPVSPSTSSSSSDDSSLTHVTDTSLRDRRKKRVIIDVTKGSEVRKPVVLDLSGMLSPSEELDAAHRQLRRLLQETSIDAAAVRLAMQRIARARQEYDAVHRSES